VHQNILNIFRLALIISPPPVNLSQ